MKKVLMLFIVTIIAAGLNSCKKDKEEIVIEMISPESGKTYPNSGSLAIKAKISGHEIDDVKVEIKKKSTGEKVFEFEKHVHAKSYNLDETWTWDAGGITAATMFEFKLKVEGHDDDDETELKFDFTIAP